MNNNKDKSLIYLHLAIFFWGFTGVLGRAIDLTAPLIVGYRMFFTALIIALLITVKKQWIKVHLVDLRKLYGIGFLFAIHWVAFYWSIKLSGAAIAMICLATASIFTAIVQPIMTGTKIKVSEILIGAMALAGVMIMYFFQEDKTTTAGASEAFNFKWGIILGVVAAIISAVFTVFNKGLSQKYDSRIVVVHEMTAGLILLVILSPFYFLYMHEGNWYPQGWDILWLFCLVYFCTVLGQQFVVKALKNLEPFLVTLSVNIEPIYGIILAFILFNENLMLNWSFYVGFALILISLIIQVYLSRHNKKAVE